MIGIKDLEEVSIVDDYWSPFNQFLRYSVDACEDETNESKCASIEERRNFFEGHVVVMIQGLSYVDYEDVEAEDGHVKTVISDIV